MSWKNWPSWLKGGVIGGGIGILLALLEILLIKMGTFPTNCVGGGCTFDIMIIVSFYHIFEQFLLWICFPILVLFTLLGIGEFAPTIVVIGAPIEGFIIGVIIGKIKEHKK